jgi:hypothetical protein
VQTKVVEVYSYGTQQIVGAGSGDSAAAVSATTSASPSTNASMPDYPIGNTDAANRGLLPY